MADLDQQLRPYAGSLILLGFVVFWFLFFFVRSRQEAKKWKIFFDGIKARKKIKKID